MPGLLTRLRARVRNRHFNDDLAEELRFHEAMKQRELESRGASADGARAAARRALGNATLMREESRGVWIAPWLESVLQDARYAVRTLVRQPLHSFTTILVLVVALGLNTSLFTFFKAVALEPWPAKEPERLVQIRAMSGDQQVGLSLDEFRFIQQHAVSFSGVAAHLYNPGLMQAAGIGDIGVQGASVSANLLGLLGANMHLGRGFLPDDERPSQQQPSAILSYHLWRTRFGAGQDVVGRTIEVNRKPFVIIGVLDEELDGLANPVDVWLPLSHAPMEPPPADACCVSVVGRIVEQVEPERARTELQVLHEQFTAGTRRSGAQIEVFGTAYISMPGRHDVDALGLIWVAVLIVLLLACANVGNLHLARGLARRRELVTRIAIGGSRGRIVRQLMTEALVLSFVAGAISVAVAAVLPNAALSLFGQEIPPTRVSRFRPDGSVVGFAAAFCFIASVAFSLVPSLRATRTIIPLGAMDRGGTRRMQRGLRSVLLALQVATCTVLLVGAGLVTRAIVHATSFDPGFRADGVLRVSAFLPRDTPDDQQNPFLARLFSTLETDGSEPVAVSTQAPLVSDDHARFYVTRVVFSGRTAEDAETVQRRSVSAGYFQVLGIPLRKGRLFASNAPAEIVVNEAFVRTYFAHEDPLGKTIHELDRRGRRAAPHQIVGVVGDAYLAGLEQIRPMVFRQTTMGVFLTRGGPAAVERIRAAALALNASANVRAWPLAEDLRDDLEASRQGAAIAWAISLLGLALAMVGVFGVFAYAVEERRREIGVRLTLGASRSQIVRTLVSTSGRALACGLAFGVLLSFGCGPLLRSYLFGLSPLDPLAYGMVLALLAGAGLAATVVPARRACRVDPAVTLREE